jgi:hypothetical protein
MVNLAVLVLAWRWVWPDSPRSGFGIPVVLAFALALLELELIGRRWFTRGRPVWVDLRETSGKAIAGAAVLALGVVTFNTVGDVRREPIKRQAAEARAQERHERGQLERKMAEILPQVEALREAQRARQAARAATRPARPATHPAAAAEVLAQ